MRTIHVRFLYGLLWVVTLPPLICLRPLAYAISWVLHHLVHYRRTIIKHNLSKSFPEKSGRDLLKIENDYYKWLGRLFIESFKVIHWGPERLKKRVKVINPEIIEAYSKKSQDIIVLAAHTGNWEWSPGAICPYGFDVLGVYKPQSNKTFDELIKLIRKSTHVVPIPMKGTMRALLEDKSHNRPSALLLIADQTPALGDINYWTEFLNQDTPWFTGAEKIAKRLNLPVIYMKMTQKKPGYYRCEYLPLSENGDSSKSGDSAGNKDSTESGSPALNISQSVNSSPTENKSTAANGSQAPTGSPVENGQLTQFFVHALEHTIKDQPAYWLWSHRRWKHQR